MYVQLEKLICISKHWENMQKDDVMIIMMVMMMMMMMPTMIKITTLQLIKKIRVSKISVIHPKSRVPT